MRKLTLSTIFLLLAACGGATAGAAQTARTRIEPDSDGAPPTEDPARFARANNAFSADLWAELRERDGNLAVSPASISLALAMTHTGARGETAGQMARTLHMGDDAQAYHQAAGAVLSSWNDPDREAYELAVANRLFGQRGYRWRDGFTRATRDVYGAPLEPVDFREDFEPTRVLINEWVERQTRDRIANLIPSGGLDDTTRMVLVNAIYFRGDWRSPFDPNATHDQAFHAAGGSRPVPTMHQRARLAHGRADGVQLLEMPYAGDDLSMVIALPESRDGIDALEAQLTAERLDGWIAAMRPELVEVALPKFRVDPEGPIALGETLQAMGMTDAFTQGRADFRGMADPAETGERLYVSRVFHKAFVAVDEEGTEAAAATAVVMSAETAVAVPPQTVPFVADHPFLFFIRDVHSGAILFVGRVADPAA